MKKLIPSLSKRGAVDPFIVMDVMIAANEAELEGRHIIHMEVGQPSQQTPKSIRKAVKSAIDVGNIGYTLALGLDNLREKLSAHYKDKYNLNISASRFALTMGSSSGRYMVPARALYAALGFRSEGRDAAGIERLALAL